MREVTSHKANGLNEAITILVVDEPGAGGANHAYELSGAGRRVRIEFQKGPIKEAGLNGLSNEALLAIVADRLECFQRGPFKCKDNEDALGMVKGGLTCLLKRTQKRLAQGIEGTNVQHVEPATATALPPAGTVFTQSSTAAVAPAPVQVDTAAAPDVKPAAEPAGAPTS
jgi:hypothetical protein